MTSTASISESKPAAAAQPDRPRLSAATFYAVSIPAAPSLSRREIEVMLAWLLTDSKAEVCRRLFIATGTVNTHIGRVREKYAAAGRPAPSKAALLARALQDGLISLEEI